MNKINRVHFLGRGDCPRLMLGFLGRNSIPYIYTNILFLVNQFSISDSYTDTLFLTNQYFIPHIPSLYSSFTNVHILNYSYTNSQFLINQYSNPHLQIHISLKIHFYIPHIPILYIYHSPIFYSRENKDQWGNNREEDFWTRGGVRATSFPRPSHILHIFSSEPHQNACPSIFLF